MKQQQNMKRQNLTFILIVAWTDAQTVCPRTGKPDMKDIERDETKAKIRQRLAEGATYLSIQNELHVSPMTISKIKKQMYGETTRRDKTSVGTKIRQRLAEGATYLSIQNELQVSSKTISKIKKQMQ